MILARHLRLMTVDLKTVWTDFSWKSPKTRMALKTALACVSAILITYALSFDDGFWAGVSAIIMMKPNVGATFQKAWMRAGGAVMGCTLSIVVSSLFVQDPLGFSIAVFLIITAGFYLGATRPSGYFWSYMFGHMALISMISVMDPNITIELMVTRSVAVSIGVIVSCIVHTALWPEYAHETLQEKFHDLERDVFHFIHRIMVQYMSCTFDPETTEAQYRRLRRSARTHAQLVEQTRYEKILFRQHLVIQNSRLQTLSGHIHRFMEFYRTAVAEADGQYVTRFTDQMSILMSRLSEWMEAGDRPDYVRRSLEAEIREIFQKIRQFQIESAKNQGEGPPILPIMLFYEGMHSLSRFFKNLSDTALDVDPEEASSAPLREMHKRAQTVGFFARHFQVHLPVLQYAIKGGLGILMVFWIWLWAEIPGGGLNMSVAVITVLQLDLMSTYQRGMLRFLGCFLGAALGLLLLGLQADNTLVMSLIAFWAIFPLAYIWASGPNAAYIGAQAALALIITLFPDKGPATALAPVIERLVGIFLAVLTIWTLNLLLWPQDLRERLDDLLDTARNRLIHLGDLISRFYHGQSCERPSGIDALNQRLIGAVIDTLEEQREISAEEAFMVREWATALNDLFDETADLMDSGGAHLPILRQLRPDFGQKLPEALKAPAIGVSIADAHRRMAEIDDLMEMVRDMAEKLRELTRERDARFKVDCSLYILAVRRVLFRLKKLWELHEKRIFAQRGLSQLSAAGLEKSSLPVGAASSRSI